MEVKTKVLAADAVLVAVDQSARGSAVVAISSGSGKLLAKLYYADGKRAAKEAEGEGALPPMAVKAGDELARTARLAHLKYAFRKFLRAYRPTHGALEDYALARQAHSHALGEVGGLVRLEYWRAGIPFRAYDVQAVKLFATGRGNAEKADVVLACRDQWEGINFLDFGKTDGAAGNLADAYVLAQMLRVELRLRAGLEDLEALPTCQRRVFLRATKQRPQNLLATPFAVEVEGE